MKAQPSSFQEIAQKAAKYQWGDGWIMLSEHAKERAILAEAAILVLQQSLPEYDRAKNLIRECIGERS